MKVIKTITLVSGLVFLSATSHATGLLFNAVAGSFANGTGGALAPSSLIRYGTLSSTSGSDIATFESNFTELNTGVIAGDGSTSLFDFNAPTSFDAAPNQNIYGIVYNGSSTGNPDSAVFLIGFNPQFGFLSAGVSPTTTVLFGSNVGGQIQTAVVPEPSAYTMLSGVLALTWVMLRRRRA